MRITAYSSLNRRAFIKSCLRLGAGSGLLISAAVLGFRDKGKDQGNDICQLSLPCKGCNKFKDCSLSRARKIKNTAKEQGGNRAET